MLMMSFSHNLQDTREGISMDLRIAQGSDCEELCSRIEQQTFIVGHQNMTSRSVLTYGGGAISFPIEDQAGQGEVMSSEEVRRAIADRLREIRGDFRDISLLAKEMLDYHLDKSRKVRGTHASLLYDLFDLIGAYQTPIGP